MITSISLTAKRYERILISHGLQQIRKIDFKEQTSCKYREKISRGNSVANFVFEKIASKALNNFET